MKAVAQPIIQAQQVDNRPIYKAEGEVKVNGNQASLFNGIYFVDHADAIEITATLTHDGEPLPELTFPVPVKCPIVRHADNNPTDDEAYFSASLTAGVLTVSGTLPRSGDWKIITERVNRALSVIGAEFKLDDIDLTFLA